MERKLHHFCCGCCGHVDRHSKIPHCQVATQHGGFCGAKSQRPGHHFMEPEKFSKSSVFMVKLCEIKGTRLRLCLFLLFDLFLLVYADFFTIKLFSLDRLRLQCFVCLLCLPLDGFFSGWWKRVTGSCKSMVHVTRKLRLRSESQVIRHHNLRQLTNPSLYQSYQCTDS